MRLHDQLSGKDNNLNLIRFGAAFAVLVSHSFVLSTGLLEAEPLRLALGASLGDLAVDLFFAASGFLVARSLVLRGDGLEFVWARLLRIYPALLVMLAGCVLVLAPLVGTLAAGDLLLHRGTWRFLFQNIVLLRGVEFALPGVFQDLPWKGIVNGSLWTLTYELRLYLSLVVLWWILKPARSLRPTLFRGSCVAIAGLSLVWYAWTLLGAQRDANNLVDPASRLVLMFYSGAAWWIASKHVRLEAKWLVASAAALLLARWMEHGVVFHVLLALWIPYALWYFAFVPAGAIRKFNRFGDPSYGIYIYAFPLQQAWVHFFPAAGPWAMIAVVGSVVTGLGYLSWHLLESPCLRAKDLPRRLIAQFVRT